MPPGRPRDAVREAAIVDATIELLAESGYDGLTMEAVAARAGSSKNTIYRRWPGKHELVVDAVDARHARHDLQVAPTASLRDDLAARVDLLIELFDGWDGKLLLALLRSQIAHPELLADIRARRPIEAALPLDVVERAVARGELRAPVDPSLFAAIATPMVADRRVNGLPLTADFRALLVDGILVPAFQHAAVHGSPTGPLDHGAEPVRSGRHEVDAHIARTAR